MKIIGICGYARSGKNTFARFLGKALKENFPSKEVREFSFAAPIKSELQDFLFENLGLNSFTEKEEEKRIVRPFLIAYGNAKRKLTNGKHWVEVLEKRVKEQNPDYALITDLRFAEYEEDEIDWIKKNKGTVIYLERTKGGEEEKAPNEFEAENCPKLKERADIIVREERTEDLVSFVFSFQKRAFETVFQNLEKFI